MIQGSVILLVGIFIGYSIPFWVSPYAPKVSKFVKNPKQKIERLFNHKAKIIDMSPPVDLGQE